MILPVRREWFSSLTYHGSHPFPHTVITTKARAAERIFIGGGGGGKDKKGHCNVKKATNGVHADNYH